MIREAIETDYTDLERMLRDRELVTHEFGVRKFTTFVSTSVYGINGFFTVDLNKSFIVHFCVHKHLKKSASQKTAWQMMAFLKKLLPNRFFVAVPVSFKKLNAIVTAYWPQSKVISKRRSDFGLLNNIYLVEV